MDYITANLALFGAAAGFSLAASYYDMKTGEIPDKFTIGLVVAALAMRAVFSFLMGDFNYLIDGAIVGGLFFSFGAALFYSGGWGGGDAKLIAGIGASLGGAVSPTIVDSSFRLLPPLMGFIMALSLVSIAYTMSYAIFLSIKSKRTLPLIRKRLAESRIIIFLTAVLSIALILVGRPWSPAFLLVYTMPLLAVLLHIFTRSVEETALQKDIPASKLKEGDMVAEDIVIGGRKLASKRDMDGLTKEAIKKILSAKGAPKTVRIKWGIKFAPAFPIALLICPYWTVILWAFAGLS